MAQNKGIRIHHYPDDWLFKAKSHLSPGYIDPHDHVSGTRLDSKYGQIKTGAQTSL